MEYIAKATQAEVNKEQTYDLYTSQAVKDIDGVERLIPVKIGFFSIVQLEKQIAEHEAAIAECQAKIEAINGLSKK